MAKAEHIRNLAIIAHIDHGKTTLIDSIFHSTQSYRKNEEVQERMMDNNEIEKERGITIRSKHCSVKWNEYLINIIDTPGHADFAGEVEGVLSMVDSVLLLVDANEGPMPQTRYVLMRSLALGLKPIVIVNKADRLNCDPQGALDKTFDLFVELGATDEQCDFPVLYGSGLHGWLVNDLETEEHKGMEALFQSIVANVPAPESNPEAPFLMQVGSIGWVEHIGRTATGRILQGSLKKSTMVERIITEWKDAEWVDGDAEAHHEDWSVVGSEMARTRYLWVTRGLETVEVDEVLAGDIVTISCHETLNIGDTLSAPDQEGCALRPIQIEEPTVSMYFLVNNGPFAGKEGTAVTLRQLRERLDRELRTNVALRVEANERGDGLKVSGRGELHLAILIEEMRREGMELCVSPPEIVTHRDKNGKLLEPFEELTIDVPNEYQGTVIEKLSLRKAQLQNVESGKGELIRLIFIIPTRGLIGYRNEFLTDTRGLGVMASRFTEYAAWSGEVIARNRGSMVSMDNGSTTSYSLENLQQRGTMFVGSMVDVYEGMIIGENSRSGDFPCKPTKKKQMTNHRASGKDHSTGLDVPRELTLDTALEWIASDELVEVTPKSIRVRKGILNVEEHKRSIKRNAS